MRSLCDAGHDLVVGQTFRLKTLFVLVGLRAHGLTARDIVIGAEDPEEFHRIRIGLHEDYEPTSTTELELVAGGIGLETSAHTGARECLVRCYARRKCFDGE